MMIINRSGMMTKLNKLIKESGLKKKYIAEKLDVNLNTITNWVKGISKPDISQAKQLKEILNLNSIDELIDKEKVK